MSFRPAPDPGSPLRCVFDTGRFGGCERQRFRDRDARDGSVQPIGIEAQAGMAQIDERLNCRPVCGAFGDDIELPLRYRSRSAGWPAAALPRSLFMVPVSD